MIKVKRCFIVEIETTLTNEQIVAEIRKATNWKASVSPVTEKTYNEAHSETYKSPCGM